ncbi:MAG: DUF3987 domain-containing protein [Candidatus Limnocylindrales bacterium]
MSILETALIAHSAGLSVVPPRQDGSKAPIEAWKRYQAERPSEEQLRAWYGDGELTGIGVICGRVSGDLEMLEIEGRAVDEGIESQFRDLATAAGLGELLSRILVGYAEKTPSGGWHLLYRVPTPLGNEKLARRPATADELVAKPGDTTKVLLETRGEGGFVITAPSNGRVHPAGGAWALQSGGFESIATITDHERDELWRVARMLDRMPAPAPRPRSRTGSDRPGDAYNARPDIQERTIELLERHGWTMVYARQDGVAVMRRPGKREGVSATVGYAAPGVVHNYSSSVAELPVERSIDAFGVYAALEHNGDISAAARALADVDGSSIRINSGNRREAPPAEPASWPASPAEAAYHGLAGDVVRAVADHTEADPVAILGSLLATFGALAGHGRYLYQGSGQTANVYVALVGDSSSGRKGTAGSIVREIFNAALTGWDSILVPGLGSGEGLIRRLKPDADGNVDHRALVMETELGRLLASMAREGSTLSPMLRDGWDGVPLGRFLARSDALVTWHHVGVLAHITPIELRARLTGVDAANGFGNRFVWLAVRRTRLVAIPGNPRELIAPYAVQLRRAIDAAQDPAELVWTDAAAERWQWVYAELASRSRLGLAGSITARAEAQIVRLALIYALLDESPAVDVEHLEAGLAFWDYAERSARYLFGESTGNRHADLVLRILRADGEVDRQTIKSETGLRLGAEIDELEGLLVGAGLADLATIPRPEGGRPRRVLRLANGANGANGQGDAHPK